MQRYLLTLFQIEGCASLQALPQSDFPPTTLERRKKFLLGFPRMQGFVSPLVLHGSHFPPTAPPQTSMLPTQRLVYPLGHQHQDARGINQQPSRKYPLTLLFLNFLYHPRLRCRCRRSRPLQVRMVLYLQ